MSPSNCIPAEELALMIDGKATRRERQRWLPHLDECLDCRTVLADATSYVQELAPAPSGSPESFFRRSRVPVFALAASLLIGIWGYSFLSQISWFGAPDGAVTNISSATAIGPLFLNSETAYSQNRWTASQRGLGFAAIDERQLAFRVGAYLVDLRVALHEGQIDDALDVVERLEPLLSETTTLEALRTSIESENIAEALEAATSLEEQARRSLPGAEISFGNWVEASRLAAAARQPSYFENRMFSQSLQTFRTRAKTEPVSKTLTDIDTLASGDLSESSLSRMQRAFRQILMLN